MTVGEIAAICGIPSALTVAIVGFFVWLLERSIVKRETARAEEEAKREKARAAEEAKLEAERAKQENSRKAFEKICLRPQTRLSPSGKRPPAPSSAYRTHTATAICTRHLTMPRKSSTNSGIFSLRRA